VRQAFGERIPTNVAMLLDGVDGPARRICRQVLVDV